MSSVRKSSKNKARDKNKDFIIDDWNVGLDCHLVFIFWNFLSLLIEWKILENYVWSLKLLTKDHYEIALCF